MGFRVFSLMFDSFIVCHVYTQSHLAFHMTRVLDELVLYPDKIRMLEMIAV